MKKHHIVLALIATLIVSMFAIAGTHNVSAGVEPSSTWTMEDGIRLEGGWPGNPCIVELSDETYRMYYSDCILEYYPLGGITKSAVSADGLTWTREDGIRLGYGEGGESGYAGSPEVIVLPDESYRMYYSNVYYDAEANEYLSYFLSAVSTDGLTWTKEPGIRLDHGGTYDSLRMEHMDLVKLLDGTYRMYYSGFDGEHYRILSAISADGLVWNKEAGIRIDVDGPYDSLHALSSATVRAADGRYMMFYCGHSGEWAADLLSAVSLDGLTWTKEDGIRIERGDYTLLAPSAMVQISGYEYRMYITGDRFPVWQDRIKILSAIGTFDMISPAISIASPEGKSYRQDEDLLLDFTATDTESGIASIEGLLYPDPATIYVNPQTTTILDGQQFSVDICIANAGDVSVWQIWLGWNPTILSFVSVTEGDFLRSHGPTIWAQGIGQDYLCYAVATLPSIDVNGDGILATITFLAIGQGETTLEFEYLRIDTFLMDSRGTDLPFDAINGAVIVQLGPEVHDIAITDVSVSQVKVGQGDPVTVNVEVENQGTRTDTFDVTVYYDSNVIAVQTNIMLNRGETETFTFTWDTTGVGIGSYQIKAEATVVPEESETLDNTFVDGFVIVGIRVSSGQTIDLSTLQLGKWTLQVTAVDNAGWKAQDSVTFTILRVIKAEIDIKPGCLNLKSKGQYVTGYVELPDGYDVANINVSSIRLNGTVPVDKSAPYAIGDHDNDNIPDLMVKFNRTDLLQYIISQNVQYSNVVLAFTGRLNDGTFLKGTDIIKVSGLMGDVNCDGKVDLRDVALGISACFSRPGDPRWNDNANFAQPWDTINLGDVTRIILHCGQHYP